MKIQNRTQKPPEPPRPPAPRPPQPPREPQVENKALRTPEKTPEPNKGRRIDTRA